MNTLRTLQPRTWYMTATVLYLTALLQNVLMPLGDINVLMTAILSLSGSVALVAGIISAALKDESQVNP